MRNLNKEYSLYLTNHTDEIIFHCLSLSCAAIDADNMATREALLFVLIEKLLSLYQAIGFEAELKGADHG